MDTKILEKVLHGYDWNVKEVKEIQKGVLRVETSLETVCLKCIPQGNPAKLLFVYDMMAHLWENGFNKMPIFVPAKKGKLFIRQGGNLYYAMTWIEGRHGDFRRPYDIQGAARTLAKLDRASQNFEPPEGVIIRERWGEWPDQFAKKAKEMMRLKKFAQDRVEKTPFDEVFIKNVDVFYHQALRAIQMLAQTEYDDLVKWGEKKKFFCHHDYTYHNLIVDGNQEINVIDFELGCYEIRAYDIADLIRRVSQQNHWDIFWTECILKNYHNIYPLKENELPVILALIQFPQLFWRTSYDYYLKKDKGKEEILYKRLQYAILQAEEKEEYINSFEKEIGFSLTN